jgi:hypothetical protein
MPVKRVLDWRVLADEAAEYVPGETRATVGVMVSTLCEGDDGAFYSITRRVPLSFEPDGEVPARVKTEINSVSITAQNGVLYVDMTAGVEAGEEKVRRASMVEDVEWGDAYPADSYSRMSALIRRAAGNESLWDIAREYHTAVDAVAMANQVDVDSVPARGELLLIPMKK